MTNDDGDRSEVPLWVPTGRNRLEQVGTGRGGKIRTSEEETVSRCVGKPVSGPEGKREKTNQS
jgi:hypothetical protein